jgi:GGDEF domain-containing protein
MVKTLRGYLRKTMLVFALIFVVMFSMINLKGQMDLIDKLYLYKANMGAFAVSQSLAPRLAQIETSSAERSQQIFQSVIQPLREVGIVQQAALFSADERLVATIGPLDANLFFEKPLSVLGKAPAVSSEKKPFVTFVDRKHRSIEIMMKLTGKETYYVVLKYPLGTFQEVWDHVRGLFILTIALVLVGVLILGSFLYGGMIAPVKKFNYMARQVAAGNLDMKIEVDMKDELGQLGDTFNQMTSQLAEMKKRAEDVNPLTKLPGNIVIMQEVEQRLRHNSIFTIIYCDLNYFKAFNDKYGVHDGDRVIKMTADVLQGAVMTEGNPEDLVGHEGGDDFILVTTPDKADAIAKKIIELFDSRIKSFFVPGDLQQGSFTATGRDGQIHQFPITGISLAGVSNQHRRIQSYAEATNICAEVKKKAKSFAASAWWLDKRTERSNRAGNEAGPATK